uniref:RRM domain-containing protein n=1 Tax=viral metagenome TaxID=1070528 RepID=A0A6C0CZY4_9ZZZZ
MNTETETMETKENQENQDRVWRRRISKRAFERTRKGIEPFGNVRNKIKVTVETGRILMKMENGKWEEEETEKNEKEIMEPLSSLPVKGMLVNPEKMKLLDLKNNELHELTEEMKTKMRDRLIRTLHVSNLSDTTTESNLRWLFSKFGRVQKVYLPRQRFQTVVDENGKESHPLRGFGLITFFSMEDATSAQERLNNYGWNHVIIHVQFAINSCSSYVIT